MTRTLTSSFTPSNWNEEDIQGAAHALRHTNVHYGVSYFGEISGTSSIDLVMVYRPDGTVPFVGYEFFEGSLGPHSGTVVLEHRGLFEGEEATSELSVVPGTATGALADLTISGRMFVPMSGEGLINVEIDEQG
ncbi:MAG TPA: DUF3224 domain-containing protein [Thermomicrobiales bacterium]|nr:DUF3224 domain-containing protein [Thermomicrobiales bacterium]